MGRPLAVVSLFSLALCACATDNPPPPSENRDAAVEEVAADFCRTFIGTNPYSRLFENPDALAAAAEKSSQEFQEVGETKLAELAQTLADHLREQGVHRQLIVYLSDKAMGEEVDQLENELRNRPQVTTVEYVSKEDAFETFNKVFKDDPQIAQGLTPSDLPASFKVIVEDPAALEKIQRELNEEPIVDEVRSSGFLDVLTPAGQNLMIKVLSDVCIPTFQSSSPPP